MFRAINSVRLGGVVRTSALVGGVLSALAIGANMLSQEQPAPVASLQDVAAPLGVKGDKLTVTTAVASAGLDESLSDKGDRLAAEGFEDPSQVALAALTTEEEGEEIDGLADQDTGATVTLDPSAREQIRAAVSMFVWGLSNGEAEVVWNFALEEEQDWLGTEAAALDFFSRIHPALAGAKSLTFETVQVAGDLPVASVFVKDADGEQWRATFEMVKDEAGSWRIMNVQTDPAPGELI